MTGQHYQELYEQSHSKTQKGARDGLKGEHLVLREKISSGVKNGSKNNMHTMLMVGMSRSHAEHCVLKGQKCALRY